MNTSLALLISSALALSLAACGDSKTESSVNPPGDVASAKTKVLEAGADGAGLARFQAEQTGQPLWRYCLLAALLGLLAEVLLVRFGSRQTVSAKIKQAD